MNTKLQDLCNNWEVIYHGWINGGYFVCINCQYFKGKIEAVFTIEFENEQYATEFKQKRCHIGGCVSVDNNKLELRCDRWHNPIFLSCRKDLDLAINLEKMLKKQLYNQIEQQL